MPQFYYIDGQKVVQGPFDEVCVCVLGAKPTKITTENNNKKNKRN